jgi:hypothetical protein
MTGRILSLQRGRTWARGEIDSRLHYSGCQVRILSVEFSIPYLMNNENYPISGWVIGFSIWLGALGAFQAVSANFRNLIVDTRSPLSLLDCTTQLDNAKYSQLGSHLEKERHSEKLPVLLARVDPRTAFLSRSLHGEMGIIWFHKMQRDCHSELMPERALSLIR